MPYALNPAESTYLVKVLYLLKHFFDPNFVEVPNFFLYINSFFLILLNSLHDIDSIIGLLEVDPQALYLPLRCLNLIFGIGTIAVVFLIGNFFSLFTAVVASSLIALSFLHLKYSQLFLPYNYMTFFALLSCFFCIKAFYRIKLNLQTARSLLILSTILASLSTSMHYIGFVSFVPVLFVIFLTKEFNNSRFYKFCLTLFLLIFVLLNPYLIFHLVDFLIFSFKSYLKNYSYYHSSSYLLYLFNFLIYGIGPVAWVSAFGILKYKSYYDLDLLKIIFSLPLIYFACLGLFHLTSAGYSVLLLVFFSLASALVLNLFYESYFKEDVGVKRLIFIFLILFTFYIPLKYSIKYNKLVALADARIVATEWIKRNTTSEFKIAWDKNSLQINWFDPYSLNDLKGLEIDPELLKNEQKFLISSSFLKDKKWFTKLRKKVDYVVINNLDYEKVLREKYPKLLEKYYLKLLKLKPVVVFSPYVGVKKEKISSFLLEELYFPLETLFTRERTGPVISIYKL